MKVLMVVGRSTGGIGRHVDDLLRHLPAEGTSVRVVTAPETADAFGWAGAQRLWPVHGGLRAPRGLLDWHRIMLQAGRADVVHAHGHQAAVVAAVAVWRARPRPRFVVSLHNDLPPGTGPRTRRVLAGALRRADLVTGASSDLVDLARGLGARRVELAEVPSPRTAALLAAAPSGEVERRDLLTSAGIDPSAPLVLTISRIAPQKRLDVLVDAARSSRGRASWAVVGGGDATLGAELRARAATGAQGATGHAHVHFLGPREDVDRWLRAADVFVLTSRWEARALVVQEAMAAGLPVVVPEVGGLPALVGDGGRHVPPGDPDALARAVDDLLGDDRERRRLGGRARAVASTWATPQQEARRWAERYRGLPAR